MTFNNYVYNNYVYCEYNYEWRDEFQTRDSGFRLLRHNKTIVLINNLLK